MTPLQKSKLIQLIDRYADRRQEYFNIEFPGEKATELGIKTVAAFDNIVDYVELLIDEEREDART